MTTGPENETPTGAGAGEGSSDRAPDAPSGQYGQTASDAQDQVAAGNADSDRTASSSSEAEAGSLDPQPEWREDAQSRVPRPRGMLRRIHKDLRARVLAVFYRERRRDDTRAKAEEASAEAHDARVALESEQHDVDPDRKRPGSFLLAVLGAIGLALSDTVPAWWAAEALGGGTWSTALVTGLLVAALSGFAMLLSYFHHERNFRGFQLSALFAIALVALESGLRLDYLFVVQDAGVRSALLEVGILAAFTGVLLWVSFVILRRAETFALYLQRVQVKRLERVERAFWAQADDALSGYWRAVESLANTNRGRADHVPQLEADLVEVLNRAAAAYRERHRTAR